jgi:imidazolonepropionase-like amidohydrolase
MKTKVKKLLLIILSGWGIMHAQIAVIGKTLFTGATLHTGSGMVIGRSCFSVEDGKFSLVSAESSFTGNPADFDTVIRLDGKHVWPGIIALNTTIGLREIDAVRATNDFSETGELNPGVRSLIAYNTDSRIIPTIRANGILNVQSVPQGRLLSGTSSVFYTAGWNWEDAVLKADDGMHIFWPESGYQRNPGDSSGKADEKALADIRKLEALFTEAANPKGDHMKLLPVRKVLSGEQALYIHAEKARDIADAIMFALKFSVRRPVIMGGSDCGMVAGLLRKYQIPVVLSLLHRLPANPDEAVDLPFRLPALLRDSGITVALSYKGGMEANVRNLGFVAGTAVAYGLAPEDALKMITLNPAIIAGIDQQTGSIERGKSANFLITAGDLLDIRSAKVEQAFVAGIPQSLDNIHLQLYEKFKKKYQK